MRAAARPCRVQAFPRVLECGVPKRTCEQEEMVKVATIEITNENFEQEVLRSDKPVLLDFWASWCGPCSMLSPVVDEVAEEHPEIKVGKVNTDEQRELALKYRITAIPALLLFRDGELADQSVGAVPKSAIEHLIA